MNELTGRIDVHHHVLPREYVDRLSAKGVTKGLGVQFPAWNEKKMLEVMDGNGISTSVVSISAPGVHFPDKDPDGTLARQLSRSANESCARLIEDHPGRFGAFATLPLPDVDAALEELAYAQDVLKLDGAALLSNYDGYYLGDLKFDRLFAEMDRRRAVVFIHPASPPGMDRIHLGFPEAMVDVCFDTTRTAFSLIVNGVTKRYPSVRFILAHAGGAVPYMAARIGVLFSLFDNLKGAPAHVASAVGWISSRVPKMKERLPEQLDIYLKVKENVLPEGPDFYLKKLFYDTALSASPHAFASLQSLVTSQQILFGTDYVFASQDAIPATIEGVEKYAGFTKADVSAIERENALGLFPRLKAAGKPLC